MLINEYLEKNNMSKYQLAKKSGVPYATLNDICSGKAKPDECKSKTLYQLAKAMGVTMESLIEPFVDRPSFELFKSHVCHKLKRLGDMQFLEATLKSGEADEYYNKSWYPECLYTVAMVDYICRVNNIPLYSGYNKYRSLKLDRVVYPEGILLKSMTADGEQIKYEAFKSAIPEFVRFNIVENEVRNIV